CLQAHPTPALTPKSRGAVESLPSFFTILLIVDQIRDWIHLVDLFWCHQPAVIPPIDIAPIEDLKSVVLNRMLGNDHVIGFQLHVWWPVAVRIHYQIYTINWSDILLVGDGVHVELVDDEHLARQAVFVTEAHEPFLRPGDIR